MSLPVIQFNSETGKHYAIYNGKKRESFNKHHLENRLRSWMRDDEHKPTLVPREPKIERFGINTRFSFVEKLVTMVATGVQVSAILTGEGGLGKTYTVLKALHKHGYIDEVELTKDLEEDEVVDRSMSYSIIKGYSTARGLYRTLFENRDNIVIFDDCDNILKDQTALMILKGALDSYGQRRISWKSDKMDDDLPKSFNFEGRIIFISNKKPYEIDQAIRSRSMMIDLSMSIDQKIDRMEFIAKSDEFLPEYEDIHKYDAIEFIREIKDQCNDVSLRTLIAVTKIRSANKDWKDLATYMLTA